MRLGASHLRNAGEPAWGSWVHLGVGLGLALLLTLTPFLRLFGWFLGSLFHETGHVAFAWYVGCPAFPAISLSGHAAAFHQGQKGAVCVLIGLLLLALAVRAWKTGSFRGTFLALLLAWPFLAFVRELREVGFLLAGHLGELAFAAFFLVRARTGEGMQLGAERPLHAAVGWYLVGRNVVLAFGLAFLPSARAWYMASGSFGLTNDYARVATDHLGVPLAAVAGTMLVFALGVPFLAVAATARFPAPAPPAPPCPPSPPESAGRAREASAPWRGFTP